MTDLTVNPKIKVDATRDDVVISNEHAILIVCRRCGDTKNVSLHEPPTEEQMLQGGTLITGTMQYPLFKYCKCREVAPNSGGGHDLRQIRQAVSTCTSLEAAIRMLDYFIQCEGAKKP
jgi:hypothetical protein